MMALYERSGEWDINVLPNLIAIETADVFMVRTKVEDHQTTQHLHPYSHFTINGCEETASDELIK